MSHYHVLGVKCLVNETGGLPEVSNTRVIAADVQLAIPRE